MCLSKYHRISRVKDVCMRAVLKSVRASHTDIRPHCIGRLMINRNKRVHLLSCDSEVYLLQTKILAVRTNIAAQI